MTRQGSASAAAAMLVFTACLGPEERGRGGAAATQSAPRAPERVTPASGEPRPAPGAERIPAEPAAPALPDFSDPSWTRVESRAGRYLVCWRSLSGKVPRNEEFVLEAWVLRAGAAVSDAILTVNAWMPDHGHGMLRQPRAVAQEDGSFRVEGMLLHMRGHWRIVFEVLEGSLSEAAECGLDL